MNFVEGEGKKGSGGGGRGGGNGKKKEENERLQKGEVNSIDSFRNLSEKISPFRGKKKYMGFTYKLFFFSFFLLLFHKNEIICEKERTCEGRKKRKKRKKQYQGLTS